MTISIHASREGSDLIADKPLHDITISIHASREGSDSYSICPAFTESYFNPRFPRGKRLPKLADYIISQTYFNPRFPRGKRHRMRRGAVMLWMISIHASREGSDNGKACGVPSAEFQSTLPAREATRSSMASARATPYFNPRFPRGKRPFIPESISAGKLISIHASREGSDRHCHRWPRWPAGISIHASREGSDLLGCRRWNSL